MDKKIIIISIISTILFLILILTLLSRIIYHRSLMASIVEIYLKITTKRYTDDELIKILGKLKKEEEIKYNIPLTLDLRKKVENTNYKNMQVLIFNKNNNTNKCIIYLHGGAYFRKPRYHHIKFIKKLAKTSKLTIYVPIYPKVPNHTVLESYTLLEQFYKDLNTQYKDIYMMGDSSGGGLALGLCQYFIEKSITQPKELILFSPWVDISLNNSKINDYIKKDPLLTINDTKILGEYWKGILSSDDYRVSPLYGNMIGLNSITVFVGTREILYPDNMLLVLLLKESNVKIKLFKGEGLNHVYPIYPIIESRYALKKILKIIER